MGPGRRIKEIGLQATGRPSVVMDDEWSAVITGFEIGEGPGSNLDNSFTCQLHFLYGEYPL
jgi:hypothetical protein